MESPGKETTPEKEGVEELQQEEIPAGQEGPDTLSEVEELQAEIETLRDKWLRSVADMDNFRKRTARERKREVEFARMGVLLPLLDVLDDLERSLDHSGGGDKDLRKGVELIREKFNKALTSFSVIPFETVGKAFDPENMEALAAVPTADVEENQVIGEIRRGYRRHDRLIRPAQVSVAAPAINEEQEKES